MADPALPSGFTLDNSFQPDTASPVIDHSEYVPHLQGLFDAGASAKQIKDYAAAQGVDTSKIAGLDQAIAYRDNGGKGAKIVSDTPSPTTSSNEPPPPPGFKLDDSFQSEPSGSGEITTHIPDRSTLDQIKHGVSYGSRAALEGAGSLVDTLDSPIRAGLNAAGLPVGTAEDLATRGANALGLDKPENSTEQTVSAFDKGASSGLLSAGVATPVAAAGGLTGTIGEALAAAPVANTVGSGAASAATDVASRNGVGPWGQLGIGLGAGLLGGAVGSAPAFAGAAKNAVATVGDAFTSSGAANRAGNILATSLTGSKQDAISAIENAYPAVNGSKPTLAEVANDAGLAGMQRGHANTDLIAQASLSERNASNALARTAAAKQALGDASTQPLQDFAAGKVSSAEKATAEQQANAAKSSESRISTQAQAATQAREQAQGNVAAASEKIAPSVNREETGATARDAFESAYDAAKQRTREAYNAPALKEDHPVDISNPVFEGIIKSADDFYGPSGGGQMPQAVESIINDLTKPGITTRTLTNIDRRLADFAGEARMSGRKSEAAFAESVRNQVDDFAAQNAPPEYREALANAKAVRADQGTRFETGDVAKAFARDRFGNPVVGDTALPQRLLKSGGAGGDAADRLISSVGPDAAENIMREEIRRVVDAKGNLTGAQAQAIATQYGDAARRFPAIRSDLDALVSHATNLDNATTAETSALSARPTAEEKAAMTEKSALQTAIEKSPIAKVGDAGTEPSAYVSQLLNKADGGRQLRFLGNQVKDDEAATAGLRRSLGDYIEQTGKGNNFTASGDQIPSVNNTRKAIATVVSRAGNILTDEQKVVLTRVQNELEKANFALTASKPTGSETAINKTFADMVGHIPGAGTKAKIALHYVINALGNGEQVKQLLTKAILDPDLAASLLKQGTQRNLSSIADALSQTATTFGKSTALTTKPAIPALNDNLSIGSAAASGQQRQNKQERP